MSFEVWRCKECGWITRAEPKGSVGTAHAHAEKHASFWRLPAWLLPVANPQKLEEYVEKMTVEVVEA